MGSAISVVARSCFGTSLAYLGGLFHALGWLGPSLWRSSADLGPRPLHFPVVAVSLLIASLEQGLPLYHPPVTGMLVWHVGTRPHVAHRQSFDGLITWIACPPSTSGLLCRCAFGSLAVAARPMLTRDGASCTCRDRVWLAGRLAGTSLAVALILPHSPHAQTTPVLVMRKSCKMNTGGPPAGFYCPYHYACSIPGATCDVTGIGGTVRWASLECADCAVQLVPWRLQILVVQDFALSWQSRHPLLPFAAHLRTPGGTGDGGSGSCATE